MVRQAGLVEEVLEPGSGNYFQTNHLSGGVALVIGEVDGEAVGARRGGGGAGDGTGNHNFGRGLAGPADAKH